MEQTTFTDSDGVLWDVREDGDDTRSPAADVPPGTSWLRFESELEVRRLWHYPDDWRGLSPIQLESLLDRASTVIARFRSVPHRAANGNATLDPKGAPFPEIRAAPKRADPLPDPRPLRDDK